MSSDEWIGLSACLCSSFALVAVFATAGYFLVWRRRNDIGGRRFASPTAFVAEVSKLTGLEGSPREFAFFFDSIYLATFEGSRPSGRRARVSFVPHGSGKSYEYYVHLASAAEPEARFAVRPRGVVSKILTTVGFVEEVPTGDARFDERFSVEVPRGETKKIALGEGARAIIAKLFDGFPIQELGAEGGWLWAAAKEWKLDPSSYDAALSLVDELTATLGKPPS